MKIELFTLLVKTLFQEAEMFRFTSTSLYDQSTFYDRFYKDLRSAKRCIVIESPFITQRRSTPLLPTVYSRKRRLVRVGTGNPPHAALVQTLGRPEHR